MRERLPKIEQHPLSELWLVRRSLRGPHVDPFKTATDCEDPDEASRWAHEAGTRFDGAYIEERRKIEAWLRTEARAKGIAAANAPPLYFRLYPKRITHPVKDRLIINIPAAAAPVDAITFTIEDSFHNYARSQGRPDGDFEVHPRVLTAHELAPEITKDFPAHLDGRDRHRYIEAQLWRRDILAVRLGQQAVAGAAAGSRVITVT